MIGRHYRAVLADWGPEQALTVFRRLLEREHGAYWTFLFFTGDRYLVGASPERHVVRARRRRADEPHLRHLPGPGRGRASKPRLLEFLKDEKEIYELFMVVDEELKMMCDICHEGGQVLGPFLKPMTHLIHTEYLLAGRTARDVREVLRDTMYAATVTGSPVENACRLIKQYESRGPRLLRRRAGAVRPRPRRRAGRRQPDRHPHRRRRPRGSAQGHRRRDAGARLGRGVRGRRDPREGRRHPRAPSAWWPRRPCPRSTWPSSPPTRTC